jgi:hypothetical protein
MTRLDEVCDAHYRRRPPRHRIQCRGQTVTIWRRMALALVETYPRNVPEKDRSVKD